MLSISEGFYLIKTELNGLYDPDEAIAIAHLLLEHVTGMSKLLRLTNKDSLLSAEQEALLNDAIMRLADGEPVQYVTGEQWFMGKPYIVNKHVLIPRPETEELVQWIAEEWKDSHSLSILDIGSGSGCIPVSLELQLPNAVVTSIEVSTEALTVARTNVEALGAAVDLRLLDFLKEENWDLLGHYDVIVSNPPYIPFSYKDTLDRNVRDFEPEVALFVPDGDPLLFYRKIAAFGLKHLSSGGCIYCEVHADHALDTKMLFNSAGYGEVVLREDMYGKERMVRVSHVL
jgi:release factor glutamine methyltransferase